MKKVENIIKPFLKKDIPDVRPGDTVKVFQRIKEVPKKDKSSKREKGKEKIQIFEGIIIARKHKKEIGATITVRKVISGVGVERIFPLHLPTIKKIEIIRKSKVRRAKLYYLRKAKGKRARLKRKEFFEELKEEKPKEAPVKEIKEKVDKEKIETKEK